jgi:hypothetical protein
MAQPNFTLLCNKYFENWRQCMTGRPSPKFVNSVEDDFATRRKHEYSSAPRFETTVAFRPVEEELNT